MPAQPTHTPVPSPPWPASPPPPANPARPPSSTSAGAADKQLRDAICDFAGDSRQKNPWAANLYDRARTRGHDHPHAVRILARAWIRVIWRCWIDSQPYDPAKHRTAAALAEQTASQSAA